ncbi:FxDxF family PEP-CTERM protein [Sphingomonas nostoxanthinifaciens]|uniref:FxDxF family PEP-CTERM protein n=1 Tax=Sphingomonas nostoxanthinifaciens TaxID=2872652 RepID=UPI001CC1EA27|nr:FxDxF family PEP-CTERM protein [Sphingomonas nostoxanthinifaciens]UAK24096.1 FxDxF family PEP-CTERM protein [Sphingomonas nostoxanthinifaciens]
MHKVIISLIGLALATAVVPPAISATTIYTPGDHEFQVTGDPFSGTVSATIGHTGISLGSFTDKFQFTLGQSGVGSGSLTTSTSLFEDITDLDISSVTVNGMAASSIVTPGNLVETYYLFGVPITLGALNEIVVTGMSRGNGSYGGNVTFIPTGDDSAVPEPKTWVMMLTGFGLLGATLRRHRRAAVRFV